jgi:hypothetical protein
MNGSVEHLARVTAGMAILRGIAIHESGEAGKTGSKSDRIKVIVDSVDLIEVQV